MSKYGEIVFTGKSGSKYTFEVYSFDTTFKAIGGIYFITKRISDSAGNINHTRIYVGQTGDLSERFDNHHKADCFKKNSANCICVFTESSEKKRLEIESDLIQGYNPPCNG